MYEISHMHSVQPYVNDSLQCEINSGQKEWGSKIIWNNKIFKQKSKKADISNRIVS